MVQMFRSVPFHDGAIGVFLAEPTFGDSLAIIARAASVMLKHQRLLHHLKSFAHSNWDPLIADLVDPVLHTEKSLY